MKVQSSINEFNDSIKIFGLKRSKIANQNPQALKVKNLM